MCTFIVHMSCVCTYIYNSTYFVSHFVVFKRKSLWVHPVCACALLTRLSLENRQQNYFKSDRNGSFLVTRVDDEHVAVFNCLGR